MSKRWKAIEAAHPWRELAHRRLALAAARLPTKNDDKTSAKHVSMLFPVQHVVYMVHVRAHVHVCMYMYMCACSRSVKISKTKQK